MKGVQEALAAGRLDEAEARACYPGNPDYPGALLVIAMAYHKQGDSGQALACLDRAEAAGEFSARLFYSRGLIKDDMGRYLDAAAEYRRAIELSPSFIQAYANLGSALFQAGQLDQAVEAYQRALDIKPDYEHVLLKLGMALRRQGAHAASAEIFSRLAAVRPDSATAHYQHALALLRLGDQRQAQEALTTCLERDPNHGEAWFRLGGCLREQFDYDKAVAAYRRAIELNPGHQTARLALAEMLLMTNHTNEARRHFQQVSLRGSANLRADLGALLGLPIIYDSHEHLKEARAQYRANLEKIAGNLGRYRGLSKGDLLDGARRSNFFLAYQGGNDRELQALYGYILGRLLNQALPEFMVPLAKPVPKAGRIHVGFVSRFFYQCTVGNYFRSWITELDRGCFQVSVYHLGTGCDTLTQEIQAACDVFRVLGDGLENAAQAIRSDAPDILVYPELGMDGATFLLAALRLAPIQCVGWGHPVTTGLVNVDHFLSCAAMEPEDGESHYTERLHGLPGLGTRYAMPQPTPGKNREDFGLPQDRPVYLFPQSLFKIHPDNDSVIAEILRRDSRAVIVFFAARQENVSRAFRARLERQCAASGVLTANRLLFLSYMSREDYLAVNALCDVMLDSLHWSGGNTSLDALACGLPIVTLPGRFMRGRQTRAMLESAGVPELVARNPDHYVELAIRLANDMGYREDIRHALHGGRHRIFDCAEPIRVLEGLFRQFMGLSAG